MLQVQHNGNIRGKKVHTDITSHASSGISGYHHTILKSKSQSHCVPFVALPFGQISSEIHQTEKTGEGI